MSTTTTNLGLTLPAGTEPADIAVLNTNFGLIDTFAGQQTAKDTAQDGRLTDLETSDTSHDSRLTALETSDTSQDSRLSALETSDTSQNDRLTDLETAMPAKLTKDDVYGSGTALANGTDLNDVQTVGRYYVANASAAATIVNTPFTSSGFYMTVESVNGSIVQTLSATARASDRRFKRIMNTSGWGDWFAQRDYDSTVAAAVTALFGVGTAIESGTDLDSVTTVGTYTGASNGNYSNCPISAAFRLEVVNVAYSSRRQQRLYPQSATASAFYIRSEGPQGFGVWYKFEGVAVS